MHEEHFYGKSFHNKQKMFLENCYKHTQILSDVIQWLVCLTLSTARHLQTVYLLHQTIDVLMLFSQIVF